MPMSTTMPAAMRIPEVADPLLHLLDLELGRALLFLLPALPRRGHERLELGPELAALPDARVHVEDLVVAPHAPGDDLLAELPGAERTVVELVLLHHPIWASISSVFETRLPKSMASTDGRELPPGPPPKRLSNEIMPSSAGPGPGRATGDRDPGVSGFDMTGSCGSPWTRPDCSRGAGRVGNFRSPGARRADLRAADRPAARQAGMVRAGGCCMRRMVGAVAVVALGAACGPALRAPTRPGESPLPLGSRDGAGPGRTPGPDSVEAAEQGAGLHGEPYALRAHGRGLRRDRGLDRAPSPQGRGVSSSRSTSRRLREHVRDDHVDRISFEVQGEGPQPVTTGTFQDTATSSWQTLVEVANRRAAEQMTLALGLVTGDG